MRKRRGSAVMEAVRRWQERRAKVGRDVRSMRLTRRWTQEELGERAGIGRMMVARIEAGTAALDAEVLERIGAAFGVPVLLGFGRDPLDDVPDAGHLAMQELALRLGRRAGFEKQFELPTKPQNPRTPRIARWPTIAGRSRSWRSAGTASVTSGRPRGRARGRRPSSESSSLIVGVRKGGSRASGSFGIRLATAASSPDTRKCFEAGSQAPRRLGFVP